MKFMMWSTLRVRMATNKVVPAVTVVTPSVEKTDEVRIYVGGGHWVPLLDLSSRRYDRGGTLGDKFTPIHVLAAAGGSGLVWLMWDNENQRPVAAKVGYMNETSIEDEKNVYDQMGQQAGVSGVHSLLRLSPLGVGARDKRPPLPAPCGCC